MVDLGQKGWKQFHLFYWNKVKKRFATRSIVHKDENLPSQSHPFD
jgi:hypothetical protein